MLTSEPAESATREYLGQPKMAYVVVPRPGQVETRHPRPRSQSLVVLPTYNELSNLASVVTAVLNEGFDVLVVDDNSPDGTGTLSTSTLLRPLVSHSRLSWRSAVSTRGYASLRSRSSSRNVRTAPQRRQCQRFWAHLNALRVLGRKGERRK